MNRDYHETFVDDGGLTDRVEAWFLYAHWLWVALAILLAIALPSIACLALLRAFS